MKAFLLFALLTLTLAPAFGEGDRPTLELSILADLAYAPAGLWNPPAPTSGVPMLYCDLGLGLRLAGGFLFARASACVSVPAEDLVRYGTPATLLSKTFEVGSNPIPGAEVGLRLKITEAGSFLGEVYVHISQNIKLF